jgi:hypothetical protein
MENIELVQELCHILVRRNELELERRRARGACYRAENKYQKQKTRANRLVMDERQIRNLQAKVAIAKHSKETHQRIREITKKINAVLRRSPDNIVEWIGLDAANPGYIWSTRTRIADVDFPQYAEAFITRQAIEKMLGEKHV